MADTPHDGSGTTLSFPNTAASNAYVVTNIVYNLTDPGADDTIDISHLGLTTGAEANRERLSRGNFFSPATAECIFLF